MKKLITGGIILALALTGAPQAAAFSSGSSSSPGISQPEPSPIYNTHEVLQLLTTAYEVHFTNSGYTFNQPTSEMAKLYHQGTLSQKAYIQREVNEIGFDIQVESFPTNTYEAKYRDLVDTPIAPKNYKLVGGYIEVDYYDTVATMIIQK